MPTDQPTGQPAGVPADGAHRSGYDPSTLDAVLGEAAHLLRALGFAATHAVLIGGVVPSLLVLDPPGSRHVGTNDLDLCLSVALIEGETAEYERMEDALKRAGFAPTEQSFRWKQSGRLGLIVEFFCPAGEGRPAGRLFRPKAADNPVAKHNMGPRLTAIALDEGSLISADTVTITREVCLPEDGGRMTATFRVCGLAGFLAAKTGALRDRDKPKDAYDIVWVIENWPGGQTAAAAMLAASPVHGTPEAARALEALFDAFAAPDRLGPRSYVTFVADPTASRDERLRLARQAAGAIQELQRALTVA